MRETEPPDLSWASPILPNIMVTMGMMRMAVEVVTMIIMMMLRRSLLAMIGTHLGPCQY